MGSSRRQFLKSSSSLALSGVFSSEVFADLNRSALSRQVSSWDQGMVKHILPTVNDTQMLIKISLKSGLMSPPTLKVGTKRVMGKMEDSQGEHWSFYVDYLVPNKPYQLHLLDGNGKS